MGDVFRVELQCSVTVLTVFRVVWVMYSGWNCNVVLLYCVQGGMGDVFRVELQCSVTVLTVFRVVWVMYSGWNCNVVLLY